jgi:hypothetical protein
MGVFDSAGMFFGWNVLHSNCVQMAETSVYSLHKFSTREYIQKRAMKWKVDFEVVAELKYKLPATYKVHKRKNVTIRVDFIRFGKRPDSLIGNPTTAGSASTVTATEADDADSGSGGGTASGGGGGASNSAGAMADA